MANNMNDVCACCGQPLPESALAVAALEQLARELQERAQYVHEVAEAVKPIAAIPSGVDAPEGELVAALRTIRGSLRSRLWGHEAWLTFVDDQLRTLELPPLARFAFADEQLRARGEA